MERVTDATLGAYAEALASAQPTPGGGSAAAVAATLAASLTAMVVVPAGRMKFFAKTGAARWRTETTVRHSMGNVAMRESDGVDPMYGGGFAWMLKSSTGVRVEYERILADTADRDFFSVGVHFKF